MKASDLFFETGTLRHKLRTVSDLITHINNREGASANYNIFLGAGASVTSGIPPASKLIEDWALELFRNLAQKEAESILEAIEYFKTKHASWYKPNNPYASLFEKKCDLPSQRRRFIENIVDGKLPSIGYAYLTSLVENGYFNAIFTTNFDDLVNEAFYQFSNLRPIMCAHDSSVKGISITSSRPKIIKIHGDYLFDDIKNTLRETESLEKNTREKLIEFCKEFGLIIVGYSGSDRSVMDVLDVISKQEVYLNNGVYWCFRENDDISPELQNLLWRDKIYPVLIDGFDQLFSEIHYSITKKRLDIEASYDKSKIKSTIKNILQDDCNLSKHKIIGEEIASIKNADSRREISNFLTTFSEEANKDSHISITDSRNLFAIENLISRNELDEAYKLADQDYTETENEDVKPYYIHKIIDIFEKKGDTRSVLTWCERLIECDTNNLKYHLQKSNFLVGNEKSEFLKETLSKNQYSYEILNSYARSIISLIKTDPVNAKHKPSEIIGLLDKSITLEPSLSNGAWNDKYTLLTTRKDDPELNAEKNIKELIDQMESINPNHINTLTIKSKDIARSKKFSEIKSHLSRLREMHNKSSISKKISISRLMAILIENLPEADNNEGHKEIAKEFFSKFLTEKHFRKEEVFNIYAAEYELGINRDTHRAEEFYHKAIISKNADEFLEAIVSFLPCVNNEFIEPVERLVDKHKYAFLEHRYHYYRSEILIQKSDYEGARRHIEKSFELGGPMEDYLTRKSYVLLLETNYKSVSSLFDKNKEFAKLPEGEAFVINYQFAEKQLGKEIKKTILQNLSAQSKSEDVKAAAYCILNNDQSAKNIIKSQIKKNYLNYFKFKSWPIIPSKWLEESKPSTKNPEQVH